MTRAGVGPIARELAPRVGYKHRQSAYKVLHTELDRRGVPADDAADKAAHGTTDGAEPTGGQA
jgi:hypothetical protein